MKRDMSEALRAQMYVLQAGPANDVKREGTKNTLNPDMLKRVLQTTMSIEKTSAKHKLEKRENPQQSIAVEGFMEAVAPEINLCKKITIDIAKDIKKYSPITNDNAKHILERYLPLLHACAKMQERIEREVNSLSPAAYKQYFHDVIGPDGKEVSREEVAKTVANHYGWGIIQEGVSSVNNELAAQIKLENKDPKGAKPKVAAQIQQLNKFIGNFVMDFVSEAARSGKIHQLLSSNDPAPKMAAIIMASTLGETSDKRVKTWGLDKMVGSISQPVTKAEKEKYSHGKQAPEEFIRAQKEKLAELKGNAPSTTQRTFIELTGSREKAIEAAKEKNAAGYSPEQQSQPSQPQQAQPQQKMTKEEAKQRLAEWQAEKADTRPVNPTRSGNRK